MCVDFPDLSFASASMRMVQVAASTYTLVSGMESGPGLIWPVTFLPSQFMTKVTWLRSVGEEPQSPVQVPVRGWPCCAAMGISTAKQMRIARVSIEPPEVYRIQD